MTEPTTEPGTFLRNGLLALGFDEDSANEAVLAIEARAREQGAAAERARLRAAWEELDPGVFPASSPEGPRTHYQDGWNAAVIAVSEDVDALLAEPQS